MNPDSLPPGFAETVARIRVLDPAHPLGLYYAGLLARAAGKTAEARSLWLQVMARLPADAPQRRTLQEEIDSLGP